MKGMHTIETRISNAGIYTNTRYGFNIKTIDAWNHHAKQLKDINWSDLPTQI